MTRSRYSLRRAAFRVFSSSPSTCLSTRSRPITSLTALKSQRVVLISSRFPLQRRSLADEAVTTQSESVADNATQTEDAKSSIAQTSEASASNPPNANTDTIITSEQTNDNTTPEPPPGTTAEYIRETATSAAQTAQNVASQAAASVASAATSAGEAARDANPPARSAPGTQQAEPSPTVYVGNLFFDVRAEDLKKEFSRAGQVVDAKIITDQRGLSKGCVLTSPSNAEFSSLNPYPSPFLYHCVIKRKKTAVLTRLHRFGYVEFDSQESATKAITLYNLQNFEGRRLSVQYSNPRGSSRNALRSAYSPLRQDRPPQPPTKTLFIGNMSFDMSDRDLNNLFREVKNVIDVRVAIDRRTGQPRGFAHADFTDIESAERALEDLRGKMVCGRALRVDFSISTGRAALGQEPAHAAS